MVRGCGRKGVPDVLTLLTIFYQRYFQLNDLHFNLFHFVNCLTWLDISDFA